jgi:hypothetical protein
MQSETPRCLTLGEQPASSSVENVLTEPKRCDVAPAVRGLADLLGITGALGVKMLLCTESHR